MSLRKVVTPDIYRVLIWIGSLQTVRTTAAHVGETYSMDDCCSLFWNHVRESQEE